MIFFKYHIQKITLLIILAAFFGCNQTNWNENFKEKEKSPFGTYIIYEEAEELFNNKEVYFLKENIYDYLFKNHIEDGNLKNYICIKSAAYKLNSNGISSLLSFVKEGNNAFLSLNYFSQSLKDSLNFTTNNLDENLYTPASLKPLNGVLTLENKEFKDQPFEFDRNIRRNYVLTYNQKNTIVLGKIEVDGEELPNFIKIYYGKGAIYLHTNPIVFTNYYMLNGKEKYATNLLSYLPSEDILWDSQIKTSQFSFNDDSQESIFNFFLKHPTLKWFLYVSLTGLLLFMFFNAKRKQRPIPIITPLKNSTVEFTHTIANLYLKEEDHKNLIDKKIVFFLEKVRTKYLINTNNLNTQFIEKLALKSGNELSKTKYLINTIIALNKKTECIEEELIVLNKMIENFLKK